MPYLPILLRAADSWALSIIDGTADRAVLVYCADGGCATSCSGSDKIGGELQGLLPGTPRLISSKSNLISGKTSSCVSRNAIVARSPVLASGSLGDSALVPEKIFFGYSLE